MSKIALSPSATGTGTFTIASPGTSTNRTLTLPDETTTFVGTDATQTLTNKDIVATQLTGDVAAARITTALNASGSAPIYACRAWVNFDGTGTPAIREDGNVSSITDNGTGDYTVNFTTAMPDINYSAVATCSTNASFSVQFCVANNSAVTNSNVAPTTTAFRVSTRETTGSGRDEEYVNVAIFR
jgi:hypothetical protein